MISTNLTLLCTLHAEFIGEKANALKFGKGDINQLELLARLVSHIVVSFD